jgi:hypothetical protein
MEKIRIGDKHPGSATLVLHVHTSSLYRILVHVENARGIVQGQSKSSLKNILNCQYMTSGDFGLGVPHFATECR